MLHTIDGAFHRKLAVQPAPLAQWPHQGSLNTTWSSTNLLALLLSYQPLEDHNYEPLQQQSAAGETQELLAGPQANSLVLEVGDGGAWFKNGSKTLAHPAFACIAKWWHPTKNGGLRPQDLTQGSHKKVWLQCSGCRCKRVHEWDAKAKDLNRLKARQGIVCLSCESRRGSFCHCRSIEANSKLLQEWHPDNQQPTRQQLLWPAAKWFCGSEQQAKGMHPTQPHQKNAPLNGTDYPVYCSERLGKVSHDILAEVLPDPAEEWDYSEGNDRGPYKVTCGSSYAAWWRCRDCQHQWQTQVNHRALAGTNCPKCTGGERGGC